MLYQRYASTIPWLCQRNTCASHSITTPALHHHYIITTPALYPHCLITSSALHQHYIISTSALHQHSYDWYPGISKCLPITLLGSSWLLRNSTTFSVLEHACWHQTQPFRAHCHWRYSGQLLSYQFMARDVGLDVRFILGYVSRINSRELLIFTSLLQLWTDFITTRDNNETDFTSWDNNPTEFASVDNNETDFYSLDNSPTDFLTI